MQDIWGWAWSGWVLIIIHCFSGPHGEKIIFGYLDELQIRRTRVSQEHEICQSLRKCESMSPSIHLRVGVNVSKVYTQKKNGNFASNYGCSKMSFISLFKCPYLTQQVEHKIEICASSSDYLLIKIMEVLIPQILFLESFSDLKKTQIIFEILLLSANIFMYFCIINI